MPTHFHIREIPSFRTVPLADCSITHCRQSLLNRGILLRLRYHQDTSQDGRAHVRRYAGRYMRVDAPEPWPPTAFFRLIGCENGAWSSGTTSPVGPVEAMQSFRAPFLRRVYGVQVGAQ